MKKMYIFAGDIPQIGFLRVLKLERFYHKIRRTKKRPDISAEQKRQVWKTFVGRIAGNMPLTRCGFCLRG